MAGQLPAGDPVGDARVLVFDRRQIEAQDLAARFDHRRVFLLSLRPIAAGEDLLFDYHLRGEIDPIPCRCGAALCRGFLNEPEPG